MRILSQEKNKQNKTRHTHWLHVTERAAQRPRRAGLALTSLHECRGGCSRAVRPARGWFLNYSSVTLGGHPGC